MLYALRAFADDLKGVLFTHLKINVLDHTLLAMAGSMKIYACKAFVVFIVTLACRECVQAQPVMINEILAANQSYGPDPQGQFDDWIELYNSSDEVVDVGGLYLTDDLAESTLWQIPVDTPLTVMAPHGYLLIWADNDTFDGGLHAAFRMSAEGESLSLYAQDGTTLLAPKQAYSRS